MKLDNPKLEKKDNQYPKLESAIIWLTESGIQTENGAFQAWYDCKKNDYSFSYPEITGYSISLLLHIHRHMRDEMTIKKAISAGNWLLKIQKDNGPFYSKYFNGSCGYDYEKSLYTFDAAVCARGLLDLFKATLDEKYLQATTKITDWLLKQQLPNGSFPGTSHKDEIVIDNHWSRMSSCHHLKIILTLLDLYKLVGSEKYLISSKKLFNWGKSLSRKNGMYALSEQCEETYTHAHNYAIEGLLKAWDFFKDATFLESAIAGAKWLAAMQNNDGSFWNFYNTKRKRIKVSDATAQALRIWVILERNGVRLFSENIGKSLQFLSKMQCLSPNKQSNGGIFYGQQEKNMIEHVNSWATFFTIQALLFRHENEKVSLASLLF